MRSKHSGQLELVLKPTSKSPTKFSVNEASEVILLSEISSCHNFDRVNVQGKVIKVNAPMSVRTGKKKQDLIIADTSASAKLTIWEEMIGTISEGTLYKFCNVFVREYAGLKTLSFAKEGGNMEEVNEIKGVTTDESKSIDTDVTNAIISGIKHFMSYKSCSSCKGKMSLEGSNNK